MEAILIRAQEEGGPPHLRHNHADRADAPDMATDEELITKHPRLPIRLVPLWLRRRGWLLVVTVVAGACGGWFVGGRAHVTFSAVSTVVVPSGANGIGPGSANEAGALAVTYSAVIPTDEAILHSVSTDLGVSTSTVASRIRVSVETGTSVLDLRYTAPTASEALRGSVALARIVGGLNPVTAAIPVGSITIVQLATSVSHVGELTHFGLEIGSILGLAIGGILLFAAERADPRADSAQDAEAMSGVRSTQVPRDVSMAELARALVGTLPADAELTLVPIRSEDVAASWALKVGLDDEVEINRHMTRLAVSGPLETGTEYLLRGDGATVLVVGAGERERDIRAATERLQILERSPVWTVLVDRRTKWGDIVTV